MTTARSAPHPHAAAVLVLILAFLSVPLAGAASPSAAADAGWSRVALGESLLTASPRIARNADRVSAFRLDAEVLDARLAAAPPESAGTPRASLPQIELPLPGGGLARYHVEESSIMDEALQRRFPEIRSYALSGDLGAVGRLTRTPEGLHAMIVAGGGLLRVAPLSPGAKAHAAGSGSPVPTHLAYHEDALLDASGLQCSAEGALDSGVGLPGLGPLPHLASGGELRTYRLAVATTGEFYAIRGGTDASVLAAIVVDIDRVNLLNGIELAIRFTIVDETTDLFYTDSTTDPYTDGVPCTMRGEAAADIPAVIGADAFDVGHVIGAVPAGGCAGGSNACTAQKANGASTLRTDGAHPAGHEDFGGYRLIMHEIGHQFGAGHTWNANNVGNCTPAQYSNASAVEPDSGSTIMAYLGTCDSSNIGPGPSDAYFHVFSHDQIVTFATAGAGNDCPAVAASGNAIPVVNAGPDYTIPRGTPFTLTGSAADADGDSLIHAWEQVDVAAGALGPNVDDGTSPLFRSFPPTASGNVRTFPQWSDILAGTVTIGETLPTTDRIMTFALTTRDGQSVGGVDSDTAVITTSGSPFDVIEPGAGDVLQAGCLVEVDWIVGSAASHADEVRILFSEDGGQTFDTLLAQVPIDSNPVNVTLPCVATTEGRIKVEAVGNVFFDVNPGTFEVVAEPPSIDLAAVGGAVDGSCQRQVTFEAILSDDCGLFEAGVAVEAQLVGGVAELGTPVFATEQLGATTVQVTGTVLVSGLLECPAAVEIGIFALDGCGFAAATQQVALVTDEAPPQLVGVPPDAIVECDAVPPQAVVTAVDACDPNPPVVPAEEEIPGPCPGQYTLVRTWTSTDSCGNVAGAEQIVEVVDTTPPVVVPEEDDVAVLWPPDHQMHCFEAAGFAPAISDACSEPVTWEFVDCPSDQPEDGPGDGSTAPDCTVADDGQSFCVRAERAGGEPAGRRYAVRIEATDACGNVSEAVTIGHVHVPHSKGK